MMEECIRNTYEVLTMKQSIEDILDSEPKSIFFGNPFDITNEDIEEIIKFFEDTEEYEKCSELLELLKAKEDAEFDMFIDNLVNKNGSTLY
jgi:malate/lactate dehydrogenase